MSKLEFIKEQKPNLIFGFILSSIITLICYLISIGYNEPMSIGYIAIVWVVFGFTLSFVVSICPIYGGPV